MKRTTIAAVIVVIAAGLYLSSGGNPSPNPFVPPPKPDRPVLSVLAKLARTLLWLALLGEPTDEEESVQVVHARCDEHGNPLLDHGRGW